MSNDVRQFDEPVRMAILYESYHDYPEGGFLDGEWTKERETMDVSTIRYHGPFITFEDEKTGSTLIIESENFISAWSDGSSR